MLCTIIAKEFLEKVLTLRFFCRAHFERRIDNREYHRTLRRLRTGTCRLSPSRANARRDEQRTVDNGR